MFAGPPQGPRLKSSISLTSAKRVSKRKGAIQIAVLIEAPGKRKGKGYLYPKEQTRKGENYEKNLYPHRFCRREGEKRSRDCAGRREKGIGLSSERKREAENPKRFGASLKPSSGKKG